MGYIHAPRFFLCPYTEHQFDIRVPVVFVFILCVFPCETIVRLSCVLYLLTVEKAESSFGASPAGVEYIRAVSLCSPLISFRFSIFRLAIASCLASRFASRYASRPACRSCVSLWRLVLRPVFAACRWMRYDFRMGRRFVLLAACRLVLRLVLGVCVPSCMPPLRLALSSRALCRSSFFLFCVSALRLAIACRFCRLPIGGVFIRHRFALLAAHRMPCLMILMRQDEKRDEEARRGDGMRRKTRRGSRDEERDERREARAEKAESSYAVSPGRLII